MDIIFSDITLYNIKNLKNILEVEDLNISQIVFLQVVS